LLIVANDFLDHAEFMTAESEIASKGNRLQPLPKPLEEREPGSAGWGIWRQRWMPPKIST
jgi:hypothetical protein